MQEIKKITAVFVDYDNWFWHIHNKNATNDIDDIFNIIKEYSSIAHLSIYADFSHDFIKAEKARLDLKYPRMIHDCGSYTDSNQFARKDLTDFYLLDDIYQTLFTNPRIEQFILVVGDGHFHSAISHIRMFHQKTVGVYALKGSLSPLIKNNADWFREIEPQYSHDFSKILSTLKYNEERSYFSFFNSIVNLSSKYHNTDRNEIARALSYLIEHEYACQQKVEVPGEGERQVIKVDWPRVKQEGLWKQ